MIHDDQINITINPDLENYDALVAVLWFNDFNPKERVFPLVPDRATAEYCMKTLFSVWCTSKKLVKVY